MKNSIKNYLHRSGKYEVYGEQLEDFFFQSAYKAFSHFSIYTIFFYTLYYSNWSIRNTFSKRSLSFANRSSFCHFYVLQTSPALADSLKG